MSVDECAQRKPRKIARITTRYSSREDRLRLAVEDENRTPLNLWLTRRLSDRLVAGLLQCLEHPDGAPDKALPERAGAEARTGALAGASAQPMRHAGQPNAAALLWEQTHADLSFRKSPPVIAPPEISETGLIDTISIARSGESFKLSFAWNGEEAALAITPVFLRNFLRILHRNYGMAEWATCGVFPAWLADDAHQALLDKSSMN